MEHMKTPICLKPPSVTKNVVGLQIDGAGHVDRNSSAVGLQTDAVVVTETRFSSILIFQYLFRYDYN